MEQMPLLLFVGLLAGLWQSLQLTQCQKVSIHTNSSRCYNTGSEKVCFTTFLANNNKPVRESFENAIRWCSSAIPGSSLIIINSIESQTTAERFITQDLVLQNEIIIMDARKLSSKDAKYEAQQNDVEACVYSRSGQSLTYQFCYVTQVLRYICEFSGPRYMYKASHKQNKSYVTTEKVFTWYDARNECLRLGGDLASKTDLHKITDWSWLKENETYWIGTHSNKWIWSSTGDPVTYTNWERGYLNESSDKECICIKCKSDNNRDACRYDQKWKWLTCDCNHSYAFVCQKEEAPSDVTTEIYITGKMLSSSSEDFKSSVSLSNNTIISNSSSSSSTTSSSVFSATLSPLKKTTKTKNRTSSTKANPTTFTYTPITTIPSTTTTSAKATVPTTPIRSNVATITETRTTAAVSPSTGLFESFSAREILLTLFFMAIICIAIAVILIFRKRRKRSMVLPMTNTTQSETVSSEYATLVPFNRPSNSDGDAIYTDLEMFPKLSNGIIYANIQPTSDEADMDISVDYADVDLPRNQKLKPRNTGKMTECFSLVYSQPDEPSSSASNTG